MIKRYCGQKARIPGELFYVDERSSGEDDALCSLRLGWRTEDTIIQAKNLNRVIRNTIGKITKFKAQIQLYGR